MRSAAVVGCGRMGAFTSTSVRKHAPACWFPLAHAEAIRSCDGLKLDALCDPVEERLKLAQQHYAVVRGYADHHTLLAAGVPDVVTIATRTLGRADVLADFINAGSRALHVEKPLCNSVAELCRLLALLEDGERFVTYGTLRRYFPVYRHAVALASAGRHGRLLEVRVSLGEGALYWTQPHSVDLILFAAGERQVSAVQAKLSPLVRKAGAAVIENDPIVEAASIFFADGTAGHISRSPAFDFKLSCQSGEWTVLSDGQVLLAREFGPDNPYPPCSTVTDGYDPAEPAGTLAAIRELVACLDGDPLARKTNAVNRADMLTGQRILFAMVQSHLEGGRPVTLDDVDPAMMLFAATGSNYA